MVNRPAVHGGAGPGTEVADKTLTVGFENDCAGIGNTLIVERDIGIGSTADGHAVRLISLKLMLLKCKALPAPWG